MRYSGPGTKPLGIRPGYGAACESSWGLRHPNHAETLGIRSDYWQISSYPVLLLLLLLHTLLLQLLLDLHP